MKDENQPDNSEKESRRFALVLVFVVIIGASVIFFILQYRQAKEAIKGLEESSEKVSPTSSSRPADTSSSRKLRVPSAGGRVFGDRPDRQQRRGTKGEVQFFKKNFFKTSSQKFRPANGSEYEEVLDYRAVSADLSERFNPRDIVATKFRRIFVKEVEAQGLASEAIVRNTRTGRLGVVTGALIVRFQSISDFNERLDLKPVGFDEQRAFAGIKTAIWVSEGSASIASLSARSSELSSSPLIKDVKLEVLEHDQVAK